MKYIVKIMVLLACLTLAFSADARKKKVDLIEKYPALAPYFSMPVEESVQPDELGFIRRWTLMEPLEKPNPTNTVFVDSYIRENLDTGWNKDDFKVPHDGGVWHQLDSKLFNVK